MSSGTHKPHESAQRMLRTAGALMLKESLSPCLPQTISEHHKLLKLERPQVNFRTWCEQLCTDEDWDIKKLKVESVVTWYEIGCPGGPKVLLGGLFSFLEFMRAEYGVNRDLTLEQVERVISLKKEEMENFARYDKLLDNLKNILVFSIVAAGSNKAVCSIIYSLLRLKGLQIHDGIIIRLYDRYEHNYDELNIIKRKFNILENRMGYGFVKIVKSFKELLKDCDVLIFLGDHFRKEGMDVEKYLYKERVLWGVYGVLCNKYLPRRTKIVFTGMDNPCFNAQCFIDRSASKRKLAVPTTHLAAEVKAYVSQVGGFPMDHIVKIPIWGMVDISHVLDADKGRLLYRYPDLNDLEFPNFEAFMEKCEPGMKLFLRMVMSRKEARDAAKEVEEVDKMLNERINKILDHEIALRDKLKYARVIQELADEGDDVAKSILGVVWDDIIFQIKEGKEDSSINLKNVGQNSYCGSKNVNPVNITKIIDINQKLHDIQLPINFMNESFNEDMDINNQEGFVTPDEKIENRLEMRNLKYISSSLKHIWNYIGVAKTAVREKLGQDPFISQIGELENLLQIWFLDPLRKKEVIYLGVTSNGAYGMPDGVILSQPAVLNAEGEWEVYPGGALPEESGQTLVPYSLGSAIARARMCLKHFLISPESETIEDLLERRSNNMDYVQWRLEKLQALYEYEEMNKMDEKETTDFTKVWLAWSGKLEEVEIGEGKEQSPESKYGKHWGEGEEGEEPSMLSHIHEFFQALEPPSGTKRDEVHTRYLLDLGFYKEDDVSESEKVFGPEYDQIIKKAFIEYFCNQDLTPANEEKKLVAEEEKEINTSEDLHQYEGPSMDYETEEHEILKSPTVEEPFDDILPIRYGLGAVLDIEDEFNATRNIRNPVIEDTPYTLPLIEEKHEYEKIHSIKPGFPLNLQGKSTMDAYKMLLEMDTSVVKEAFISFANRIDEQYEGELSRGTIVEEDDGNITFREANEEEEEMLFRQLKTNTTNYESSSEEVKHFQEEEVTEETEPIKSFSTFTNETTTADAKTPSFTMEDFPSHQGIKDKTQGVCGLWTEPEEIVSESDLFREMTAVEKTAFIGALRPEGYDDENLLKQPSSKDIESSSTDALKYKELRNIELLQRVMEDSQGHLKETSIGHVMEGGAIHHPEEDLLTAYKKKIQNKQYYMKYRGEEFTMSHKEIEKNLMSTQREIKAQCDSFLTFVEKCRYNNALYDVFEGIAEPEHLPFPPKMDFETYDQYKQRSKEHAQMLKNTMGRKKAQLQQDDTLFALYDGMH